MWQLCIQSYLYPPIWLRLDPRLFGRDRHEKIEYDLKACRMSIEDFVQMDCEAESLLDFLCLDVNLYSKDRSKADNNYLALNKKVRDLLRATKDWTCQWNSIKKKKK